VVVLQFSADRATRRAGRAEPEQFEPKFNLQHERRSATRRRVAQSGM